MDMKRANLIILSGPSGSGKDTVIEEAMKSLHNVGLSISCTTREPRMKKKKDGTKAPEQHGVDYFFMEKPDFEKLIHDGGLLEYAGHNGDLYGTPSWYVEKLIANGNDVVILNVETNGAAQIVDQYPDAVSVFILPPDAATVLKRLRERNSDDDIRKRYEAGRTQLLASPAYDYVILNDELPKAAADLVHIIGAARRRTRLHIPLINYVMSTYD